MEDQARILIVEDDPKVIIFVSDTLEYMGHEVITARNGVEGLKKAQSEKPDLIILDVMMPLMDGYEVCRQLKVDPSTRYIPILMLTAKGQLQDKVMGFEKGADDYLSKPYNKAEFEARVHALLRRHAYFKEDNPDKSLSLTSDRAEYTYLVRLYELLINHFDDQELRTLCFMLGVDYGALEGSGAHSKARELITYLDRRGRIVKLVRICEKQRPHVRWDNRY